MSPKCIVKRCKTNDHGEENGVHLFKIPEIILNQGGETQGLSLKRRLTWLAIVGCDDVDPVNGHVCSRHFRSGTPSSLAEQDSEDWVPSLHLDFDEVIELEDEDEDESEPKTEHDSKDENTRTPENGEEVEKIEDSKMDDNIEVEGKRDDVDEIINVGDIREEDDENEDPLLKPSLPAKRKWAVSFKPRKGITSKESEDEDEEENEDIEDNNNKDIKIKDERKSPTMEIDAECLTSIKPVSQSKRFNIDLKPGEMSLVNMGTTKTDKPKSVSSLMASKPESKKSPQKSAASIPDVVVISDSDDDAPATPVKPQPQPSPKAGSEPKFSPKAYKQRRKSKKEEFLCMFSLARKDLVPKADKKGGEALVPTRKKLRLRTCQLQKINYKEDFDYDVYSEEEILPDKNDQEFVVKPSLPRRPQHVAPVAMAQQQQQIQQQQQPRMASSVVNAQSKAQNVGLYMCTFCKLMFNGKNFYDQHMETEHWNRQVGPNGTFECEICKVVLPNRFTYLEHKRVQHTQPVTPLSCTRCKKKFRFVMELQQHYKFHCKSKVQQEKGTTCDVCNLRFPTLIAMNQHKLDLHFSSCYRCQNRGCSFMAATRDGLKHHIMTTHIQTPTKSTKSIKDSYMCLIEGCSMTFNSEGQLSLHSQAHSKKTSSALFCKECKKTYSSEATLQQHRKIEKAITKKQCDVCLREFTTKEKLDKHKQVHVCKGVIQCNECNRWFLDVEENKDHVCHIRSKDLNNFFCDICGDDFSTDKAMLDHRESHKKFYQCGKCFWEATSEAEYFDHRQIHMLFNCEICCDEFNSELELETHKQAHNFHVKTQSVAGNDSQPVMFLCPNMLKSMMNMS